MTPPSASPVSYVRKREDQLRHQRSVAYMKVGPMILSYSLKKSIAMHWPRHRGCNTTLVYGGVSGGRRTSCYILLDGATATTELRREAVVLRRTWWRTRGRVWDSWWIWMGRDVPVVATRIREMIMEHRRKDHAVCCMTERSLFMIYPI